MFKDNYIEWCRKQSRGIVDFYGQKFLYYKKVLDLGSNLNDHTISKSLFDLGAEVSILENESSKKLAKTNQKINLIKTDINNLNLKKKFDIVVDLNILCYVDDYEKHLKDVCNSTTHLVLETAVSNSTDPSKYYIVSLDEQKIYLPSANRIEEILIECGMNFRRLNTNNFNSEEYTYNWEQSNDDSPSISNRRIWYAAKKNNSSYYFLVSKLDKPEKPKVIEPVMVEAVPVIPPKELARITNGSGNKITNDPRITHGGNSSKPRQINASIPEQKANIPVPAPAQQSAPKVKPVYINKTTYTSHEKKFAIVIPSYKNEAWCIKNIESALNQNHPNFRIIFTDDCSPDNTFNLVSSFVSNHPNASKCTLIQNKQRVGALENLYNMIHSCNDDEIVLTVDGDDWLPHDNVLNYLDRVYSTNDVWMTYGQYKNSTDGGNGVADKYPDNIVNNNSFRGFKWCASHLRTFYSWLFKNINKEDLMYEGKFLPMTWDLGMMFPMLEMAGKRSKFLSEILYTYNLENPINDHKVNVKLQQLLDRTIRKKPKYQRIEESPLKLIGEKKNVGLILIATNKYKKYVQPMISSADKYFLKDCNVTYYLFSDEDREYVSERPIRKINIEHKPFPYASMDRFKHFTNNKKVFNDENYLYYVDVDCLFVDTIDSSILSDLVGVQHCGYYNNVKTGTFEDNPKSCLYLKQDKYKHYFGGGFNGGSKDKFLELSKTCYDNIEKDLSNGIMPRFHDESSINFYFALNSPTLVLNPEYHYPQGNINHYKKIWGNITFKPKILLLDKNHKEMRS